MRFYEFDPVALRLTSARAIFENEEAVALAVGESRRIGFSKNSNVEVNQQGRVSQGALLVYPRKKGREEKPQRYEVNKGPSGGNKFRSSGILVIFQSTEAPEIAPGITSVLRPTADNWRVFLVAPGNSVKVAPETWVANKDGAGRTIHQAGEVHRGGAKESKRILLHSSSPESPCSIFI